MSTSPLEARDHRAAVALDLDLGRACSCGAAVAAAGACGPRCLPARVETSTWSIRPSMMFSPRPRWAAAPLAPAAVVAHRRHELVGVEAAPRRRTSRRRGRRRARSRCRPPREIVSVISYVSASVAPAACRKRAQPAAQVRRATRARPAARSWIASLATGRGRTASSATSSPGMLLAEHAGQHRVARGPRARPRRGRRPRRARRGGARAARRGARPGRRCRAAATRPAAAPPRASRNTRRVDRADRHRAAALEEARAVRRRAPAAAGGRRWRSETSPVSRSSTR